MKLRLAAPLAFLALTYAGAAEAARKAIPPAPEAPTVETGDAPPRAQSSGPAGTCLWASRTYSEGALFCIGPKTALKCVNAAWQAQNYEPCGNAAVIDAK